MCRFTLYLGPPIRLSSLLLEPEHSLIRQSAQSKEREEPLNGDGFGVGWYANELSHEPAVFRSITPAWNNRNLRNLSRVVASDCILAHVRAATQSSGVNEANCHPFRFGPYLFMHNGDVGNFRQVRRKLLNEISDEAFANVHGSTDSEHLFAVVIDELHKLPESEPSSRLAAALERAIERVISIVARSDGAEPCHLNCAIADGTQAIVSRFANDPDEGPPTLYYYVGQLYGKAPRQSAAGSETAARSIIVSSERLTAAIGWEVIPPNHMILLRRDAPPEIRSLAHLATLKADRRGKRRAH